jgi:hypothetical protein
LRAAPKTPMSSRHRSCRGPACPFSAAPRRCADRIARRARPVRADPPLPARSTRAFHHRFFPLPRMRPDTLVEYQVLF